MHNKYVVAFVASLGILMAVLDNTIVNVALIPMANKFDVSLSTIQWVITAFFLAQAAVIPISGYLGHRYGMKRMFIIFLGLFTLSSLLCGLADSEQQLILFRVLQGLGGGALFPLAQAIANDAFPANERQKGTMIVGMSVLLGPIFGPTLGGYLVDHFGWPYIFLINLPLGILAVIMSVMSFAPDKKRGEMKMPSFDYLGLFLSMIASIMIVYAFALVTETRPGTVTAALPQGEMYGWSYWAVWTLLGGGIAVMLAFGFFELRTKDPVLDLRVLKNRTFTAPTVILWMVAMIIFGSIILLPIFFERFHSPAPLSAMKTGLALMPQGIAAAIATIFAARLYYKVGVRVIVMVGITLLAISGYMLMHFDSTDNGQSVMLPLIIRGFGFGLTFIPIQTLALQIYTGATLAKASSLLNVTRQIFSSIGVSVIITLISQHTAKNMQALKAAMPAPPPGFDPSSPEGQAMMHQAVMKMLPEAGTKAVNEVMLFLFVATASMIVMAFLLPSRKALQAMFAQAGKVTVSE